MSSCSIIYVEYKNNKDNEWHLLETFVPLEDNKKLNDQEELDVINIGEKSFYVSNSIWKYGIIRDLLTDQTKKIYGRGFPNDLSFKLYEILQNQQLEIDLLNQKSNIINHDFRYGKSWCYLSELQSIVEESYNSSIQNYILERVGRDLESIEYKLDLILNKIKEDKKQSEERYFPEDYKEELDDLIYAKGFCDFIYNLVLFITKDSKLEENIRLIYYTE